jgi:diaminohydroxyphosphoribosylaminopyrimidine deaminase/5-amino-6-(5-phosphoribosylamino)uracil reductase
MKDEVFMRQAIDLACKGIYSCMPNPRVGCVIVKNNQIIAQGWHQQAGGEHAEVMAINNSKVSLQNATLYVTLEPCCHYGKTPPCVNKIIAAKISRVVVAMTDPNPQVAGKGIAALRQAGIEVIVGNCQSEAEQINQGFIKRMLSNKPYTRLKMALSADGRSAMASGESKWITCKQSRIAVQQLRAKSCAIITGIGTVLADNPSLNVRYQDLTNDDKFYMPSRQPIRVITDSNLKTPLDSKIINLAGKVIIATTSNNDKAIKRLQNKGVEVVSIKTTNNQVNLRELLDYLANQQCNEVLVEAGSNLSGSFIAHNLVDELILMVAPKLMGSAAMAAFDIKINKMQDTINWYYHDVKQVGECLHITLKKHLT